MSGTTNAALGAAMDAAGYIQEKNGGLYGAHLYQCASTPSVMDDARGLIPAGDAQHGTVLSTAHQTKGRGQYGRPWHAEAGTSLAAAVLLAHDRLALPALASLAAGCAVRRAVVRLLAGIPANAENSVAVKWPNDILIAEQKVCGILLERAGPWLIAGIGLNVGQTSFPRAAHAGALAPTSLRMHGFTAGVREAYDAVTSFLAPLLQETDARVILDEVTSCLWMRGKEVVVRVRDADGSERETARGILSGINEQGNLLLDTGACIASGSVAKP